MMYIPQLMRQEVIATNERKYSDVPHWGVIYSLDLGGTWDLLGGCFSYKHAIEDRDNVLERNPDILVKVEPVSSPMWNALVRYGNRRGEAHEKHWEEVGRLLGRQKQ